MILLRNFAAFCARRQRSYGSYAHGYFNATMVCCNLWPPYVIGQSIYIFILWFLLVLPPLLFSSPNLSGRRLDVYTILTCGLNVNLECRSETCCARLAENTARKKIAKKSLSGHHPTTLSGYIFAIKACIDNRKKTC